MAVQGSIGTTLRVAVGAPATYDLAGIDTLQATATLVGEISSYGEYGGSGTVETYTPIDTCIVNKAIGVIDYGQLSLSIGKDATDDGQILLKDGFDGTSARKRHTFIITFPDGTREAFTGKISSYTTNLDSAGSFVASTCNVELDNQVLPLEANEKGSKCDGKSTLFGFYIEDGYLIFYTQDELGVQPKMYIDDDGYFIAGIR